jgi:hypothetical protein
VMFGFSLTRCYETDFTNESHKDDAYRRENSALIMSHIEFSMLLISPVYQINPGAEVVLAAGTVYFVAVRFQVFTFEGKVPVKLMFAITAEPQSKQGNGTDQLIVNQNKICKGHQGRQ